MNVTHFRATEHFSVESILKSEVLTSKSYDRGSDVYIQWLKEKYGINCMWEFGMCWRRLQAK